MSIKIKKKIGDKEIEIEISNEEILKAVGTDKTLMMELLPHHDVELQAGEELGAKKDEKKDEKSGKDMNNDELKKMKAEVAEVKKLLADRYKAEDTAKADAKKSASEKKLAKILDKAVKEGRLGKDDTAEYEKDYADNPDLLEKTLGKFAVDKSKVDKLGKDEAGKDGSSGGGSGSSVYTSKEIAEMTDEEFKHNEKAIDIAHRAGNIIIDKN